jgi:hypothetical protein
MRAAREDPSLMFDHIRRAWIAWLRCACTRRPVLLVIEDLHWADESSVQLVDAALGALADERFMVLALSRPEIRMRRPWATRRPHELRLDPLAKRAAERLVRDALGDRATDEIVAGIVARAEGHALFLEELVRAAADAKLGALPVGVIGTLQLRFDSLGPESRSVLRVASVYGERFTHAGVAALVSPAVDIGAALAELVAAELIGKAADGYAFRHALVREAAYALLADDDRALAHALAAQQLEREGAHEPAVIGRHYELGARRADAGRWYMLAAERALARNDIAGALAHAGLAQSWIEDGGALGELDLLIAEAEMWRGDIPRAREAAQRAVSRLPAASAAWFTAAGLIATSAGQLGDNDAVADWLERVLDMPPDTDAVQAKVLALSRASSQLAWGDQTDVARRALVEANILANSIELGPMARARLEYARAFDAYGEGVVDICCRTFAFVAELYERVGAARDALQARMIGATMSTFSGLHAETPALLRQYIADAERLNAQYLADWARYEHALALMVVGDRSAAASELARVPTSVRSTPLFRGGLAMTEGWSAFLAGDVDGVARALAAVEGVPLASRYRAACAAFAAYIRFTHGETAEAAADARDALNALANTRGMQADVQLIGVCIALTILVETGAADARALVAQHIARLEDIAGRINDRFMRDAFLHNVPWIAGIRALPERLA